MPPPRVVGQFIIVGLIGKGRQGKVYRAIDTLNNNEHVAIKAIKYSSLSNGAASPSIRNEITALQRMIGHPHIVTLREIITDAFIPSKRSVKASTIVHENNHTMDLSSSSSSASSSGPVVLQAGKRCLLLVMDLEPNGELMQYLLYSHKFSEPIARYYFRQMLSALVHAHVHGIAHRDIKPENLLLDENFHLKVSDWGLATIFDNEELNGRKSILRTTHVGTKAYMAPEIYNKTRDEAYSPLASDVWSIGVILFTMITGFNPFNFAGRPDWWYDKVAAGQWEIFWTAHERYHVFSPGLKQLLQQIFEIDPRKRIHLEDITSDPWTLGMIPDNQTVYNEMVQRRRSTMNINGTSLDDMLQGIEDTQQYYNNQNNGTMPNTINSNNSNPTNTMDESGDNTITMGGIQHDQHFSQQSFHQNGNNVNMEQTDENRSNVQPGYMIGNLRTIIPSFMLGTMYPGQGTAETATTRSSGMVSQGFMYPTTHNASNTSSSSTSNTTNNRTSSGYGFKALPNRPPKLGGTVLSTIFSLQQRSTTTSSDSPTSTTTSDSVHSPSTSTVENPPTTEIHTTQITEVIHTMKLNDTDDTLVGESYIVPKEEKVLVVPSSLLSKEEIPYDPPSDEIRSPSLFVAGAINNNDQNELDEKDKESDEEDDYVSDNGEVESMHEIPSYCLTWFPIPTGIKLSRLVHFIKTYLFKYGYRCKVRVRWFIPKDEIDKETIIDRNRTKMSIKLKIRKIKIAYPSFSSISSSSVSSSSSPPDETTTGDTYANTTVEMNLRIYSTNSSESSLVTMTEERNSGTNKTKYVSSIPTIALEASGISYILLVDRVGGGNHFVFQMLFRKLRRAIEKMEQ